jgi:electron-transferring-flavoprotein dehydrogenase
VLNNKDYGKVSVLVVGAGPAGLAAAIQLKILKPQIDVCVIEKAADLGNHNLSGAVLEAEPFHTLLDSAVPGWRQSDTAKDVLANKIDKDDILFLLGRKLAFNIFFAIKLSRIFRLVCVFTDHPQLVVQAACNHSIHSTTFYQKIFLF